MKARKGNTKALIGLLVLFGLLVFYKSALASNVEPNIPPDPKVKIITEAIKKLSGSPRGRLAAVKELQNAGEYAIPYMLDAMADPSRKEELPNIVGTLPQIGRDAIRPLTTALQTNNVGVKAEIIKALGSIGYPQSLAYLKYIVEKDDSAELRSLAEQSIRQIDPVALTVPAAELFYRLGEEYSSHDISLAPAIDAEFANIWFWDSVNERLERKEVGRNSFYQLMAERACEWALKADPGKVNKLQMPSENNTKAQKESVQVAVSGDNLMVFGVPLNASLQEVVSALEKNGIKISAGYLLGRNSGIIRNAGLFGRVLRDEINWTYDFWKISTPRKEAALKLLEEGKLKGFCYEYKGEKYFAKPTSLMRLLYVNQNSSEPGIYPVLEDFPDIYNSQFVLECEDFPAEMDSQGISEMLLFFKSTEQKEPTCFLIRIFIGGDSPGLSKLLADKYGTPTLFHARNTPVDKWGEAVGGWPESLTRLIKWNHPFREGEYNTTLWDKVNTVTIASYGKGGEKGHYLKLWRGEIGPKDIGISKRFENFLFKWEHSNIIVTLSGMAVQDKYSESSEVFSEFYRLDYIDLPSVVELSSMYEKLYSASEEAKAKVSESGKSGF